jgi:hypothetical protein
MELLTIDYFLVDNQPDLSYPLENTPPVRNHALLLRNEVRAQNNSRGVRCPVGISNGVHEAALLTSFSKPGLAPPDGSSHEGYLFSR